MTSGIDNSRTECTAKDRDKLSEFAGHLKRKGLDPIYRKLYDSEVRMCAFVVYAAQCVRIFVRPDSSKQQFLLTSKTSFFFSDASVRSA